jgi:hypothetical protein
LHLSTDLDSTLLSELTQKASQLLEGDSESQEQSTAKPLVPDLHDFLESTVSLDYFRRFLVSEHSEENLTFWEELQAFKALQGTYYACLF